MAKPNTIGGYNNAVTEACERVLVTLLRKLGPWRDSIFLVGGLAPRYLIKARPPDVPAHAGTGDVDVVVDIAMLSDTEAYQTLEENLHAMNFERATNDKGAKQSWRWKAELDGGMMILEFLADDPDLRGGKVQELPTKGGVSAVNIPNASMVFDHHEQIEITAELLDGGGRATETVRYADIVSFTCLKAFAFDERFERKDAHDIVYCLEYIDGGVEAALERFKRALDGNSATGSLTHSHGFTAGSAIRTRRAKPIAGMGRSLSPVLKTAMSRSKIPTLRTSASCANVAPRTSSEPWWSRCLTGRQIPMRS